MPISLPAWPPGRARCRTLRQARLPSAIAQPARSGLARCRTRPQDMRQCHRHRVRWSARLCVRCSYASLSTLRCDASAAVMGVDQLFVKAWLMEREEIALTESYLRSADREVREVDRLDPFCLRIDHQCAESERDAVGDPGLFVMQAEQPGLAGQRIRQRPLPELKQQQRQGAAE